MSADVKLGSRRELSFMISSIFAAAVSSFRRRQSFDTIIFLS